MNTNNLITRADYMQNSSELHHTYFLQFATESTKLFILSSLKIEDIKKAIENGDVYLNKIKIPYNNMSSSRGGWWWDDAPINYDLISLAGESVSKSVRTCIGKAMARELAKL